MTNQDLLNNTTELNFNINEWTYLPNISHIIMSEDAVLYPDDYHQYYFDNANSLLYRRYAKKGANGSVVKTGDIELVVDYACILGFKQAIVVPEGKRVGVYNDRK